jgi:hypothetical protein
MQIKMTKRYLGGGGGGSTTTTATIPDWMVPTIQETQGEIKRAYIAGDFSAANKVGSNPFYDKIISDGAPAIANTTTGIVNDLDKQRGYLQDYIDKAGWTAMDQEAAQRIGETSAAMDSNSGASGVLGSARSALAKDAAVGKIAADNTKTKYDMALGAAQAYGSVANTQSGTLTNSVNEFANLGGIERGIEKEIAGANAAGLTQAASLMFNNPARQSTTASGGK